MHFRFPVGSPVPIMVAGEGLESMLSLTEVMPAMPAVAALTANHLAAFRPPTGSQRLYIAADADAAGRHGIQALSRRAGTRDPAAGACARTGAVNEDPRRLGPARLTARLRE
ncbi:MAG: toprim domain-containing protein [Rhizobiaceae bacterium]